MKHPMSNPWISDAQRKQLEETQLFLLQLAKHLEANDMPGQAGNCTIQTQKLYSVFLKEGK